MVGLNLQYRFQRFDIGNNNNERIFSVSYMPCVFFCISSNNLTIYNYYCCAVAPSNLGVVVINKVESSIVNVSLTFSIQSNNNIKVINSGNYGSKLHILQL